jgi:hypothetical protein
MALCSAERLSALQVEALDIFRMVEESPPSIGEGMFVAYDKSWAREHGLGAFGRMTIKDGEKKFHAAPLVHHTRPLVTYSNFEFFDWSSSWLRGESPSFPAETLAQGSPSPVPVRQKNSDLFRSYERALFTHLLTYSVVTLVNPSFGAMTELASLGHGFVTFSAGVDQQWIRDAHDFVKSSHGRLKILPNKEVRGVCYLGTNSPLWYPSSIWVRLILSPAFEVSSVFENFSLDYMPSSFLMRYEKKDKYTSLNVLDRDSSNVVYNSSSVDSFLGMKKQAFLLESSDVLSIPSVEDNRCYHTPWFLNYAGEWSELEGRQWLIYQKTVVDVKDVGTYVSRRRFRPPKGYSWTPFVEQGTHWVTYSTNSPCRKWSLNVVRTPRNVFTCFDHSIPVSDVRRDYSDTRHRYILRDGEVRLDNLFLNLEQGEKVLAYVFLSPMGDIFDPALVQKTGLLHVPRSGFQIESQLHVPVYYKGEIPYVDVSSCPSGPLFVLSQARYLSRICAMASVYLSDLTIQYPYLLGAKETSISDQISYDKLSFRLRSHLEQTIVTHPDDIVPSVSSLAKTFDVPQAAVLVHLNRTPDYYCWLVDGPVRSSYVAARSLQIQFTGEPVVGLVHGKYWSEVLLAFSVGENVIRSRFPLTKFIGFLEANGMGASLRREAAFDEWTIFVGGRRSSSV